MTDTYEWLLAAAIVGSLVVTIALRRWHTWRLYFALPAMLRDTYRSDRELRLRLAKDYGIRVTAAAFYKVMGYLIREGKAEEDMSPMEANGLILRVHHYYRLPQNPVRMPRTVTEEDVAAYQARFLEAVAAFERKLPALLLTYRNRYVALRGEEVVDDDSEEVRLVMRVGKRYPNDFILVEWVVPPEERQTREIEINENSMHREKVHTLAGA